MSREDIQNILIRLTDVTGYAFQDSQANAAFQTAINEIERLLADERERVREMCDKVVLQYPGELKSAWGVDLPVDMERVANAISKLIRQLDLTAPSTEEGKKI